MKQSVNLCGRETENGGRKEKKFRRDKGHPTPRKKVGSGKKQRRRRGDPQ